MNKWFLPSFLTVVTLTFGILWSSEAIHIADAKSKKLYCWDENDRRICSDTLSPEAVNQAHDEISATSGLRSAEIQKNLNPEERAALAASEAQQRADSAAEQTRRRTEQAMLNSFDTEEDLRRVFSDRSTLIENNIATARFNATNIREGLIVLLKLAGNTEISNKKVAENITFEILDRHLSLLAQQHLQANFEHQRSTLDAEVEQTIRRYRELKKQSPEDIHE